MSKLARSLAVAILMLPSAAPGDEFHGREIQGKARVIDADTIEIGGTRLALFGIDAPAENETCERRDALDGQRWNCGQQASWALAFTLAEHWVTCRPNRMAAHTAAGDTAAICTIGPGQDIALTMLRQGWARAEESSPAGYPAAEVAARQERLGLWQ